MMSSVFLLLPCYFNLRPGASTRSRFFLEATGTFSVDSFPVPSSEEPFSLDPPCLEGLAPFLDSPFRGGKEPAVLGVRGPAFSFDSTIFEATLEWELKTPAPIYGMSEVCNT
jgi:hypothetical protein